MEILESYRFEFEYSDDCKNTRRRLKGMRLPSSGGEQFSITSVRAAIEHVATRMISYNVTVPELPSQSLDLILLR